MKVLYKGVATDLNSVKKNFWYLFTASKVLECPLTDFTHRSQKSNHGLARVAVPVCRNGPRFADFHSTTYYNRTNTAPEVHARDGMLLRVSIRIGNLASKISVMAPGATVR
jgi:hypothetical protein